MTERGLPIVDGAPACPFVAFESDRDERATSPDHRHRCYAETRPAPRALAHQEAYCLASAFPVCPTFQDWARREAARARAGSAPGPDETRARSAGADDAAGSAVSGVVGAASAGGLAAASGDRGNRAEAPGFLAGRSQQTGGGLAGSTADRIAGTGDEVAPDAEPGDDPPSSGAAASGEAAAPGVVVTPPDRPSGPRPTAAPGGFAASRGLDDDFEDDSWESPEAVPQTPPPDRGRGMFGLGGDRRPKVGDTRPRRNEVGAGPPLDRPGYRDAYPTLRTRTGMGSVPRIAVMALALVIAALALFFLPTLLGLFDPEDRVGGGPTPSGSPSVNPSTSAGPTPSPAAPTPTIYVVKAGDTLSAIATEHGLTLAELVAANREALPDPDNLQIGDELIIPPPGASAAPAPSGAPGASSEASPGPS